MLMKLDNLDYLLWRQIGAGAKYAESTEVFFLGGKALFNKFVLKALLLFCARNLKFEVIS
jgi:hypothetical protein